MNFSVLFIPFICFIFVAIFFFFSSAVVQGNATRRQACHAVEVSEVCPSSDRDPPHGWATTRCSMLDAAGTCVNAVFRMMSREKEASLPILQKQMDAPPTPVDRDNHGACRLTRSVAAYATKRLSNTNSHLTTKNEGKGLSFQ